MGHQPCLKELGVQERLAKTVDELFGSSPRHIACLERASEHPCFKKRFKELVRELAAEVEAQTPVRSRKNWMDVTLGNMPDVAALRLALEREHVNIGDVANRILDRVIVAPSPVVLEPLWTQVSDFGFFQGAIRSRVYKAALEQGLCLCPAEFGPQLRLQYLNQLVGESIVIGMEPLCDDGCLRIFMISMGRVPNLIGLDGNPEGFWPSDTTVVFCRPKEQPQQ